jgi:Cu/Ag efflux pump CusA
MAKIATYTGLALLVFAGAALDSRGLAGWIAVAGVLAGFGLIGAGVRMERKAEEKSRQKIVA